jgi:hypothetical protein
MGKVLKFPERKSEISPEVNPWASAWGYLSRHSRSPAIFDVLSVQDIAPGFDDESGKKLEILFPSRTLPTGDLTRWCSLTEGDRDRWRIIVQRQDGKEVSGRVCSFTLSSEGVVAHVHLHVGYSNSLPNLADPKLMPKKLCMRELPSMRVLGFVTQSHALTC